MPEFNLGRVVVSEFAANNVSEKRINTFLQQHITKCTQMIKEEKLNSSGTYCSSLRYDENTRLIIWTLLYNKCTYVFLAGSKKRYSSLL